MQKIGGAIERIDDPLVFGAGIGQAGFFGENAMLRIRLTQHVDDRTFGSVIDFRHKIVL